MTKERPPLSNVSNKISLSIDDLHQQLVEVMEGWPKNISGTLCYQKGDKLRPLNSATALFAWIDKNAAVTWHRGAVTKEEFFEGLLQRAEAFDWSSPHPHFPRIPGVYYTCTFPKAKNNGMVNQFLDFYKHATPEDRELLKGFLMTLYWGGPPGKRPAFVITAEGVQDRQRGCGTGKTTVVEKFAKLVSGYISIRQHTSPDRIIAVMLSPSSWPKRVALIDNLKTYRFSNELIESLVTCEDINGHQLNHGHASRPNLLTFAATVNGASFSKDMSQRTVPIFVSRPETSGTWDAEADAFIDENREAIAANVRWLLERPAKRLHHTDRWPRWCVDVLSRLKNPNALLRLIALRRDGIDEDDQDAVETIEHIRACLSAELARTNLDTSIVRIPTLLLGRWVRQLKTNMSDRQIAQYLKQLQSARLQYSRTKSGRFYLWIGKRADLDSPPLVLTYTVDDNSRRSNA